MTKSVDSARRKWWNSIFQRQCEWFSVTICLMKMGDESGAKFRLLSMWRRIELSRKYVVEWYFHSIQHEQWKCRIHCNNRKWCTVAQQPNINRRRNSAESTKRGCTRKRSTTQLKPKKLWRKKKFGRSITTSNLAQKNVSFIALDWWNSAHPISVKLKFICCMIQRVANVYFSFGSHTLANSQEAVFHFSSAEETIVRALWEIGTKLNTIWLRKGLMLRLTQSLTHSCCDCDKRNSARNHWMFAHSNYGWMKIKSLRPVRLSHSFSIMKVIRAIWRTSNLGLYFCSQHEHTIYLICCRCLS